MCLPATAIYPRLCLRNCVSGHYLRRPQAHRPIKHRFDQIAPEIETRPQAFIRVALLNRSLPCRVEPRTIPSIIGRPCGQEDLINTGVLWVRVGADVFPIFYVYDALNNLGNIPVACNLFWCASTES